MKYSNLITIVKLLQVLKLCILYLDKSVTVNDKSGLEKLQNVLSSINTKRFRVFVTCLIGPEDGEDP